MTIAVIVFALVAISVESQMIITRENYGQSLRYSLAKTELGFDYSCDEPVYSLLLSLTNAGSKSVDNFLVSVTNPLCVGAVSQVPSVLASGQSLELEIYSVSLNGTVTVSGNHTMLLITF